MECVHRYSAEPACAGRGVAVALGSLGVTVCDASTGEVVAAYEHERGEAPTDGSDPTLQPGLLCMRPAGWQDSSAGASPPVEPASLMDAGPQRTTSTWPRRGCWSWTSSATSPSSWTGQGCCTRRYPRATGGGARHSRRTSSQAGGAPSSPTTGSRRRLSTASCTTAGSSSSAGPATGSKSRPCSERGKGTATGAGGGTARRTGHRGNRRGQARPDHEVPRACEGRWNPGEVVARTMEAPPLPVRESVGTARARWRSPGSKIQRNAADGTATCDSFSHDAS